MIVSPERVKRKLRAPNDAEAFVATNRPPSPPPSDPDMVTVSDSTGECPAFGSFGLYEFLLLILTQCGYLPVAANLLATTFFEPSKKFCTSYRTQNISLMMERADEDLKFESLLAETNEFHSLLFDWNSVCVEKSMLVVRLTTTIMVGGICGSFIAGFVADRFGRKPVVVGTLLILSATNAILALAADQSVSFSFGIFFIIGCACGGYMVTNVVFILEAVQSEKVRLLVASLNGWPLGMAFAASVGFLSTEWRSYFWTVSLTSVIIAALLYSRSFESVGWLDNQNRAAKAAAVRQQIGKQNCNFVRTWSFHRSAPQLAKGADPIRVAEAPPRDVEGNEEKQLITDSNGDSPPQPKTYLDLFRHSEIRRPLLALIYCFLSSSVISFGFYFTAEVMPGSRYVNMALMGILKFALGLLPFFISYLIPKKRIILISVGAAAVCCWALVVICTWLRMMDSVAVTVLGVAITASMDPTWKISHLYSVELFPTAVRNMARGACNVMARVGSMAGPLIIVLRTIDPAIQYWLFAFLLTSQWIVLAVFMPHNAADQLPDSMPSKNGVAKSEQLPNP